MRIGLVSMGYLPYVRRRMRPSGLRLTVRRGNVYTIDAVEIRQPDSDAQLAAREILARASAMAKRDMADGERRLYWMTHAAEAGYKTARGACVAYWAKRLKEEATREATALPEAAGERRARRKEEMKEAVEEEIERRAQGDSEVQAHRAAMYRQGRARRAWEMGPRGGRRRRRYVGALQQVVAKGERPDDGAAVTRLSGGTNLSGFIKVLMRRREMMEGMSAVDQV